LFKIKHFGPLVTHAISGKGRPEASDSFACLNIHPGADSLVTRHKGKKLSPVGTTLSTVWLQNAFRVFKLLFCLYTQWLKEETKLICSQCLL